MLLLITVVLLVLGTFMETIAIIIIVAPVVMPAIVQYGIDPVHFGILLTINLAIGATPPARRGPDGGMPHRGHQHDGVAQAAAG